MQESDFNPDRMPGKLVQTEVAERNPDTISADSMRLLRGLAFLPNPLPPTLERDLTLGKLYDSLSTAERLLHRLDGQLSQIPHPASVMAHLRNREAQQSSRIENTHASLEAIAHTPDGEEFGDDAVWEVKRNYSMIRRAIESVLPVGRSLMLNMHRTLIIDDRLRPGQFRTIQVFIGSSKSFSAARFVPPPALHVESCLQEWERAARAIDGPMTTWPYWVRLGMLHYQFEAIHPFSDGNGRIGRALVNVAPVKDGVLQNAICHISEWLAEHRQEYYDRLLAVSTQGDWVSWIDFFCRALGGQAQLDLDRVDRLSKLYKRMKASCEVISSSTTLQKSLDEVFRYGYVSAKRLVAELNLAPATSHDHINKLISAGVLNPRAQGRGIYFAPAIFNAIRGDALDNPI